MSKQIDVRRAIVMRPEDLLPDTVNCAQVDGMTIRKGTIAAFLQNVLRWMDPGTDENARKALVEEMVDVMPALHAVGVFDVFELRDETLRVLLTKF